MQSRKAVLRMDIRFRPVFFAIVFKSMVLAISINWRSAAKVRLNLGFLTALKASSPSARVNQVADHFTSTTGVRTGSLATTICFEGE
jgi:hypothetical protein